MINKWWQFMYRYVLFDTSKTYMYIRWQCFNCYPSWFVVETAIGVSTEVYATTRNEHSNQSHSQDYMVFLKIKICKDYDRFEILFCECWFTVISFCDNCHMWMRVFETFNCESYSNFFGTACCLFILDCEFSFDMYLKFISRFTRVHFRNY